MSIFAVTLRTELAKCAARRAAIAAQPAILTDLRANVEATETIDGVRWGMVYLRNAGRGHSFAGQLSALAAQGLYRPTGDEAFGWVRL